MDLSIIIPDHVKSEEALSATCIALDALLDQYKITGYETQYYLSGQHSHGPCIELYIDDYQTLSITQINGLCRAIDVIKSLQTIITHETIYSLHILPTRSVIF